MNIKEELLGEHSKAQCMKIVAWVGAHQKRFDELFSLFLGDDKKIVQRSAWPVSYCIEAYPKMIDKHWDKLLKKLQQPNLHDAVKRNGTRLMQFVTAPEAYHGEVMDLCFRYLESPTESVGTKVFSMGVLEQLVKIYPEIKDEIRLVIEDQLPHQTPGFKSRAKHLLNTF